MRYYPSDAREFLNAIQMESSDSGDTVSVIDGSRELLVIWGCNGKEWAFGIAQIKNRAYPSLQQFLANSGTRQDLADKINRKECLRALGADLCRCGQPVCVVSEVLLS